MTALGGKAERLGHAAHRSDWLDHAVRVGLVAYGVVHLMIAWVAIQLAFGDRSGAASSSGALHTLARQPFGELVLWVVAVGLFLLVVWRLLEAGFGHRDKDGVARLLRRLGSAGMAVVYGWIGVSALQTAVGARSSQGGGSESTTARLMSLPTGQILVALVGLTVVGVGVGLIVAAWTEKFAEHLDANGRSGAYLAFGKVGYTAKGIAIGIVGGLFGWAALTHDADKSGGLDQALHQVREQPFGQLLLAAIALGIGCYGLFCFAQARHLSR